MSSLGLGDFLTVNKCSGSAGETVSAVGKSGSSRVTGKPAARPTFGLLSVPVQIVAFQRKRAPESSSQNDVTIARRTVAACDLRRSGHLVLDVLSRDQKRSRSQSRYRERECKFLLFSIISKFINVKI